MEHLAIFIVCGLTFMLTIDCWIYIKKLPKEVDEVKEEKINFPDFYIIYIEEYEILKISEAATRLICENAFLYESNLITKMTRITFNEIGKFEMAANILLNETAKFNIEFEYF